MAKVKTLFVSDAPVLMTGFGRAAAGIIRHLDREKYDVVQLGVNYSGDPHEYDWPIYPAKMLTNPNSSFTGEQKLPAVLEAENPDIIFCLNDIWVIERYLKVIRNHYVGKDLPKVIVYFPVDGEGYQFEWFQGFDIVTKTVVYTQFAYNEVNGTVSGLDLSIIPHAMDEYFYQIGEDRDDYRRAFYKDKLPDDAFIVFNGNMNQPRKMLDISLLGFALFAKDRPNAFYHHHAGLTGWGWDIHKLVHSYSNYLGFDLAGRIVLTNNNPMHPQVSNEQLNQYYNAATVGINTSQAEGFSLVSPEHALTGAAQVVPNHTATAELWADCGILLNPVAAFTEHLKLLRRYIVSAEGVNEALTLLYDNTELRDEMGKKAQAKWSGPEFSWDTIGPKWNQLFDEALNAPTKKLIKE